MSFSFSKTVKGLVAGGVAVMIATNGFAANDGVVGATSEGDLDISLTILDEVRISNLADITLGTFTGADLVGSSGACVYRNGTGLYEITATGDGGVSGTDFELADAGGTNTVAYSVSYDDGTGASTVTSGTALTGQTGGDTASDTCATIGADNGDIEVTVLATDMTGLVSAAYSGTLTLSVSPE